MTLELVACLAMADTNAYHHLMPLASHPKVSHLWIVRSEPIQRAEIPKASYILVPTAFKAWRFLRMAWACFKLGRRKEVKGFVSINPLPYGFIPLLAAIYYRKPIHFGFVGSDWNRHAKGRLGPLLQPLFRLADFITSTGPTMRNEMIASGMDPERIAVLPNCINLDAYHLSLPESANYTCIYVGRLVQLKRVDLILDAFADVVSRYSGARLCIVGDGPLRNQLEERTHALGIASAVDFTGHVDNVQALLTQAKIILIASDMEGMPFALVEGICSGLVPISTTVGTIRDWIKDGHNGLFFPQGDAHMLAQQIVHLLENPDVYTSLRTHVLELRQQFSYEFAQAVWDRWLCAER